MKNEMQKNHSFISFHEAPTGENSISRFQQMVDSQSPFTFVRFSDGEIEILRNRKLIILNGLTEFRGRQFTNNFPDFDQKQFEPIQGQVFRSDLLASAMFLNKDYYKGVPTLHNDAINDREFMLRLNGGFTPQMTFSDLFLNSNFLRARTEFFPKIVASFESLVVVGNWRCELKNYLNSARLVKIPDNFFSSYESTLDNVMAELLDSPSSSLVLSSASSLSNIIGHKLRLVRPDITFLDIGTVLNDLLGLPLNTRTYHKLMSPQTMREKFSTFRYKLSREYLLSW